MIYKYSFVVLVFMWSVQTKSAELPNWLIGIWKSNEKMTLNSMNSKPDVTEAARSIFSNDFFGKLIQIYNPKNSASYFLGEEPEVIEYAEYENISIGENTVTFTHYSESFKKNIVSTLYREGECFYIHTAKWEFREYFCPYVLK